MIKIKILRTERHQISLKHPMYKICDDLCFKSKNLYNYANYTLRHQFIETQKIQSYNELTKDLKYSEPFKELGSNSSQHTLKMLDKAWKSFFIAIKDYSKNPHKYLGRPKLPKYKDKNGRYVCVLTNWQSQVKDGYLYFAFKRLKPYNNLIKTNVKDKHLQTRIIPNGYGYTLEIVYEKEIPDTKINDRYLAIDLGLNNFATVVNNIGLKPIIINGKGIKSYNQYWNKQIAKYRSLLKTNNNLNWSCKLAKLTLKRDNKLDYFMHQASRYIVDYCECYDIKTIVAGKNKEWKQNCKLYNANQQFIQMPYERFILKLKYKCEDIGIQFTETEESYTSGTSFLDDELPIKENYNKSRRIYRGLFKSNNGKLINADINGAYQIMRKVFPNVKVDGIVGLDLVPTMINL